MRPMPLRLPSLGRNRSGGDQAMGIALVFAAVLTFTLMDATAKYLTQFYHPIQVVWARFAVNLALVAAFFGRRFGAVLRTRQPGMQTARAAMQIASVVMFFTSIQFIGLAEATAIMDINPVLITLGAALFLGERIGWRRILGILAALIGAMLIIRPGIGVFQPAAILPMIGAFTYAAGALLTRVVRFDSTATSVLWSALLGAIAASFALPFVWSIPEARHLWAFALVGFFGTISQAMLIRGFSLAEASVLAPFGYTGLIWASLWGWLFFAQIPDRWTIAGATLIVSAGLYVWAREARQARPGDD